MVGGTRPSVVPSVGDLSPPSSPAPVSRPSTQVADHHQIHLDYYHSPMQGGRVSLEELSHFGRCNRSMSGRRSWQLQPLDNQGPAGRTGGLTYADLRDTIQHVLDIVSEDDFE